MKSKTASTPQKKKSTPRESKSVGTAKTEPSAPAVVAAPQSTATNTNLPPPSPASIPPKPLVESVVTAVKKMLKPKSKTPVAKAVAAESVPAPQKSAEVPKTPAPVTPSAVVPQSPAAPAKPVPKAVPAPTAPAVKAAATAPASPVSAPATAGTTRRKKVEVPAILLESDTPPPPTLAGPGQKFSLGAAPVRPSLDGPEGELPDAYGTKKLFLTARDPHWLYAHWDLTMPQQLGYNAESADGHLVLRVYAGKFEGHPLYEIHVHPESRHWFIHVEKAGNSYCAELGYYSPLGKWTRIATSSATITPPDAASPETDVEFATIPFEFPFAKLMQIISEAVSENLPLAQAIEELRRAGHPDLPRFKTNGGSSPVLAQAHYGGAVLPATWTPEQEQALAKVISIDQSRRIWMGSLEITELIRRRLTHEISSPMRGFGGPEVSGLAGLVSRETLSSPVVGFGAAPAAKNFWFNVNAELIVYGATDPGAKVTLGGHEIKLRPDGTFSYRFALPDGHYDLPAVAVSVDGADSRTAQLQFSRETAYSGEVGTHPQDPALKPPLPENLAANL